MDRAALVEIFYARFAKWMAVAVLLVGASMVFGPHTMDVSTWHPQVAAAQER